jgi:hypothetical protein
MGVGSDTRLIFSHSDISDIMVRCEVPVKRLHLNKVSSNPSQPFTVCYLTLVSL